MSTKKNRLRHIGNYRLSRRRMLASSTVAAAGAAGLALVGCGDDDDSGVDEPNATATQSGDSPTQAGETATQPSATATPTPEPSAIRRGGTMNVVWETEPPGTLDPHVTIGGFSRPMVSAIFEGFLFKPAGQPAVGMLANSWEEPDAQTFIFKLEEGVKFHDGSDLTADIAKWNFERILGEGKLYEGGYTGAAAGLSLVEAIDDLTLRVEFDSAKVDSLTAFYWVGASGLTGMASRQAVESLGDGFDRNPVGTGPFMMQEWASGRSMTMDAFPDYWLSDPDGNALPYLDSLVFLDIPELNVAVLSLERGEVDSLMVGPQEAEQLESNSDITLTRKLVPDLVIYPNHTIEPFSDPRLRKAVAFAIDREEVMEAAYFGQASSLGGGYHPDGDWHDPDFVGQTHDPEMVRGLLAEAGVPDGFSFEMAVLPRGPRKTAAEVIQAQLSEFGIDMQLALMESSDYVTRLFRTGDIPAVLAGAGTSGLNPTPTTVQAFLRTGRANNPTPEQAEVGLDLFAQAQTEFDLEARYEIFQELAQWFWIDFVGRIDVGREAKIHAGRSEFGGFDWYGPAPQGRFTGMYQRNV